MLLQSTKPVFKTFLTMIVLLLLRPPDYQTREVITLSSRASTGGAACQLYKTGHAT